MQKRFLAMLMAAVMLLGLLTACGKQASGTNSAPSSQRPAVSSPADNTSSVASTDPATESKPTETVDPSSTLLPDLRDFLYREDVSIKNIMHMEIHTDVKCPFSTSRFLLMR